jgi:hypothetical protein
MRTLEDPTVPLKLLLRRASALKILSLRGSASQNRHIDFSWLNVLNRFSFMYSVGILKKLNALALSCLLYFQLNFLISKKNMRSL